MNEPTTAGESPEAGGQSEVELDSLGHLFIELADTSYSPVTSQQAGLRILR